MDNRAPCARAPIQTSSGAPLLMIFRFYGQHGARRGKALSGRPGRNPM